MSHPGGGCGLCPATSLALHHEECSDDGRAPVGKAVLSVALLPSRPARPGRVFRHLLAQHVAQHSFRDRLLSLGEGGAQGLIHHGLVAGARLQRSRPEFLEYRAIDVDRDASLVLVDDQCAAFCFREVPWR